LAKVGEYAHPEMIVSTEWVAESDEDILLYETGLSAARSGTGEH
jgi:hypothetical protein